MTNTLREMIVTQLKRLGADGLVNPCDECGCGIEELGLCEYPNLNDCVAAKWRACFECERNGTCDLQSEYEISTGCYFPIEDALRKEIAQLQADNRSLVEQMNKMALKPNQAIIERHEYDHDNPETYPEKRGFYICESASGKIELFWSPLGQEWYITEVHDKAYNHFQINAYYTWVKAPKGVKHD